MSCFSSPVRSIASILGRFLFGFGSLCCVGLCSRELDRIVCGDRDRFVDLLLDAFEPTSSGLGATVRFVKLSERSFLQGDTTADLSLNDGVFGVLLLEQSSRGFDN